MATGFRIQGSVVRDQGLRIRVQSSATSSETQGTRDKKPKQEADMRLAPCLLLLASSSILPRTFRFISFLSSLFSPLTAPHSSLFTPPLFISLLSSLFSLFSSPLSWPITLHFSLFTLNSSSSQWFQLQNQLPEPPHPLLFPIAQAVVETGEVVLGLFIGETETPAVGTRHGDKVSAAKLQ